MWRPNPVHWSLWGLFRSTTHSGRLRSASLRNSSWLHLITQRAQMTVWTPGLTGLTSIHTHTHTPTRWGVGQRCLKEKKAAIVGFCCCRSILGGSVAVVGTLPHCDLEHGDSSSCLRGGAREQRQKGAVGWPLGGSRTSFLVKSIWLNCVKNNRLNNNHTAGMLLPLAPVSL